MSNFTVWKCLLPNIIKLTSKNISNSANQNLCKIFSPHTNNINLFSTSLHLNSENEITVTFKKASGDEITTKAKIGDSILDVVVNNNVDLDGFGACEGTLTCSTCHCILKQEDYDRLPNKPGDEEMDMLDLAYGVSETSRLGCQVTLTKELDGLELKIPATVNDARSS